MQNLNSKNGIFSFNESNNTIIEHFGGGVTNILPNAFSDIEEAQEWLDERDETIENMNEIED